MQDLLKFKRENSNLKWESGDIGDVGGYILLKILLVE